MSPLVLMRLTRFFLRNLRYPAAFPARGIAETRGIVTPGGTMYDTYVPRKERYIPAVVLHGITLNGSSDSRLVHFCRSLASVGVPCAVPFLPDLSEGRFTEGDVDRIVDVTGRVCADGTGAGIIGFSFGGGYGLLASCDEKVSELVKYVIAFGSYYSLGDVFRGWLEWDDAPADGYELDNRIYTALMCARRDHRAAGLEPGALAELDDLLRRYCDRATPEEKKSLYEKTVRGLDPVRMNYETQEKEILGRLSLAGRLGACRAAVSLIHDAQDTLVPPGHSERIYAELMKGPSPERHRLLLTTLVSHVSPGRAGPGEVYRLYRAMAPVCASPGRGIPERGGRQ